MVNLILYLCFFFLNLIFFCYLYLFRELLYMLGYWIWTWIFLFSLSLIYSLEILKYGSYGIEENLIIQDLSDIFWVMCYFSFIFSLFLAAPYFLFLIYLFNANFLTKGEQKLWRQGSLLLFYLEGSILFILFYDTSYSSFFDLPGITLPFFELQLELESYWNLLLSFFFDLNKSVLILQVVLSLYFSKKYFYFKIKNEYKFLFFLSFFLFFYWFGGESLLSDILLMNILLFLTEILYLMQLITKNLRRFKLI